MSYRGTWVTEFIYCDDCAVAVERALSAAGFTPQALGAQLPRCLGLPPRPWALAGHTRSTYDHGEVHSFESEALPAMAAAICGKPPGRPHDLRVVVLPENGEPIYFVVGAGHYDRHGGEEPKG